MINQKLVQQDLSRKGRVRFAINDSDSPKGKIARQEVKSLDRDNKQILAIIPKFITMCKRWDEFLKKYRKYLHPGMCDFHKLAKLLEAYEEDTDYYNGIESGLDDIGFFEDIE